MKIANLISAWRMRRDRKTLARFNKQFAEQQARFRADIGAIIADHVAKELLQSGATIKRGLRQLELTQEHAISDCLDLISNVTLHDGPRRRWLIGQLKASLPQQSQGFWQIADDRLLRVAGGGQAARAAAERLWDRALHQGLDQVDKYVDGLTSPKMVGWPERHPVWMLIFGAIIAAAVGWVSKLLGLL